jgi:formylglycine-generating enzyme required for sulfatase activity
MVRGVLERASLTVALAVSGCGLDSAGLAAGGAADAAVDGPAAGSPLDGATGGPKCQGLRGPSMVAIGSSGDCVDSTEVTNADYAAFLGAIEASGLPGEPAWCAYKTGFAPGVGWPYATGDESLPVVWVDWCDARLYCLWAGKRLCGGTGGQSNPVAGAADPAQSEWFAACSAGGTRAYPYGANYDQTACFSQQAPGTSPVAVATHPNCVGGYLGIYDMSGNAWEWEDSCDGYTGANDDCLIRGGGTSNDATGLTCATRVAVARNNATGDRGFRCCSP